MLYIANAFSLGMLSELLSQQLTIIIAREVTLEEARELATNASAEGRLKSIIGHESTAKLATQLLGMAVACRREAVQLQPGDELVVLQVLQRLPVGKVLTEEELSDLLEQVRIRFYHVRVLA